MDVINYILSKKLKKYVDDSVGNVPDEKITEAVNTYLDKNPVAPGATSEQAEQIQDNTNKITELKGDLVELIHEKKITNTNGQTNYIKFSISANTKYEIENKTNGFVNITSFVDRPYGTQGESLADVISGKSITVLATVDASYIRVYSDGSGDIVIRDLSKKIPSIQKDIVFLNSENAENKIDISNIESNLSSGKIELSPVWEIGAIDASGNEEINDSFIRTNIFDICKSVTTVYLQENFVCNVYYYKENGDFVKRIENLTNKFYVDSSNYKFRLIIRKNPIGAIQTSDGSNIKMYQLSIMDRYVNRISSNIIISNILNGITITDISHKLAIVDDVKDTNDGTVFASIYVSDTSAHEGTFPYSIVSKFNILKPYNAEEIEVFKRDLRLNQTYVIAKSFDMAISIIDDATLRCVASCALWDGSSTTWGIAYRDVDTSTSELSNGDICKIKINNDEIFDYTSNNCPTIRQKLGITKTSSNFTGAYPYMPQIIKVGNYYYAFTDFCKSCNALIKSTDCITWEFVAEIPLDNACGEFAMKKWNEKIVLTNRTGDNFGESFDCYIFVYDTSANTWDKLFIPCVGHGAKPNLAIQNNIAYFWNWSNGSSVINGIQLPRTYKTLFAVNLNTMELLNQIELSFDIPLCDSFLAEIGTSIFAFVSTDKRGLILNESSDGRSEVSISYFNPKLIVNTH